MADASAFSKIRIGIASPDEIRLWSYGEVKKPETINYRTFKPERDGLFCERIFGPVKDFSKEHCERMGHIELAAPICVWYFLGEVSLLETLLNIEIEQLRDVIYFRRYIVTYVDSERINNHLTEIRNAVKLETEEIIKENWNEGIIIREQLYWHDDVDELAASLTLFEKIEKRQLITEDQYRATERLIETLNRRLGEGWEESVKVGLGGAAIKELLLEVDLEKLSRELKNEVANTQGPKQHYTVERLEIVEAFIASNVRPEWMIADVIPVSAPEMRPLTQADIIFKLQSELADLKGSSEHDDEDEEDLE